MGVTVEALFVGGSQHGRLREIDTYLLFIHIPKPLIYVNLLFAPPPQFPELEHFPELEFETYRRITYMMSPYNEQYLLYVIGDSPSRNELVISAQAVAGRWPRPMNPSSNNPQWFASKKTKDPKDPQRLAPKDPIWLQELIHEARQEHMSR